MPRKVIRPPRKPDARYGVQPSHTKAVKTRSLAVYRASRSKDFELSGNTILRALDYVSDYTTMLPVQNDITGKVSVQEVIRLTELANLLNTTYQTLWRWITQSEQIPAPILSEVGQARHRPVYHVLEARVIIEAVGNHCMEYRYFRKDHSGTVRSIFQAITAIRSANYGEPHGAGKESRPGGSKTLRKGIARKG